MNKRKQISDKKDNPSSHEVELTVLAPMYNEADNVNSTVAAIHKALADFDKSWELLLVDDGSSDNTLAIARELEARIANLRVISYPVNWGRGKALRTGFEHARGLPSPKRQLGESADRSRIGHRALRRRRR